MDARFILVIFAILLLEMAQTFYPVNIKSTLPENALVACFTWLTASKKKGGLPHVDKQPKK